MMIDEADQLHRRALQLWNSNRQNSRRLGQALMVLYPSFELNYTNVVPYSHILSYRPIHSIDNNWFNGRKAMNSSLSIVDDKIFILQRTVNYDYNNGDYIIPDNVIRSDMWLLIFDIHFNPISRHLIPVDDKIVQVGNYFYQGYEDGRLLPQPIDGNITWKLLCNRFIGNNIVQHSATLTFDGENATLDNITPINVQGIEKNWIPLEYANGQLLALYKAIPYTIIGINKNSIQVIYNEENPSFEFELRGGCLFKIDERLFHIGHQVGLFNKHRYYINRFSEVCDNRIISTTPYFKLNKYNLVEYIMGGQYINGQIILTVGINDSYSRIVAVDPEWLYSNLLTLSDWQEWARC